MRLVDTAEHPADPVGELVSTEQPLGLDDLAFAVYPLGLYGIEPRAFRRQKAGHYPYSGFAIIIFDLAIVGGDPVAHFMTFMPGGVVPDQKQRLLASGLEFVTTPLKKLRGYGAHRAAVNESQPGLFEFRQIQPVAGQCLWLWVVLSRLFLDEARGTALIGPRMQVWLLEARKPHLILKAHRPLGMALGKGDQPITGPFCARTLDRDSLSSVWLSPNVPRDDPGWPGWSRR